MARFTAQPRQDKLSPSRRRANYLARQERDFLANLISLRKEAGLTQKDIAQKLGVSQQAISKFESLESSPTLSTAMSYAHAVEALVHFEVALDKGRFEEYGENWVSVDIQEEPAVEATESQQDEIPSDFSPQHFIDTANAQVFADVLKNDLALVAGK